MELRISSKAFNHTPDVVLETKILALHQGKQQLELVFGTVMPEEQYVFLFSRKNPLNAIAIYSRKDYWNFVCI